MAYEPIAPCSTLVRCIDPPLPPSRPVPRPNSSAKHAAPSTRRGRACGCGRGRCRTCSRRAASPPRTRPRPLPGRRPGGSSRDEALEEQSWARSSKYRHSIMRPIDAGAASRARSRARALGHSVALPQYSLATNSSSRWEAGDHLRAVGGDDDLLLDPGRRHAVLGRAVRLERDDHALLQLDRVLERVQPADDRALVQEQPDAVAELEPERLHLAIEPELLGLRPDAGDLVGRDARAHQLDRGVDPLARLLVRIALGIVGLPTTNVR